MKTFYIIKKIIEPKPDEKKKHLDYLKTSLKKNFF